MTRSQVFRAASAATLSIAMLAGGAQAADYVVLDSDVAGVEPGLVSAGEAIIVVPAGGTVVLIDPVGETRVISGPFTGAISDATTSSDGSVLERLTAGREQEKTTLGAVRAPKFEGGGIKE